MATRRQVREAVVSLLYSYELGNKAVLDSAHIVFDEKKIRNAQREYGVKLLEGVLANIDQIDASIVTALDDRGMDGIGSVEKAVLRLGAYEITHAMSDRAVIINEAVEISKLLGAENSAKFVNGVLDAVKAGEAK
jgi:transcription antitermination protein NusB